LEFNVRKKLVKCYIWIIALCGAETWRVLEVERKYVDNFEMWCCRNIEVIGCTDSLKNEEVLQRIARKRTSYTQ
jgi:hypothetical protein